MNRFIRLLDKWLFALANWRASQFPRNWKAYKSDGTGSWPLGEMLQADAVAMVTKDGAHKIRYVDPDESVIIYE